MPLDPAALITQAEQEELNALLVTAIDKRDALNAALATLDQFLRDRVTADVGMIFDFFDDGELKPAMQVTRPGGRRPAIISEKITEQREHGAHPSGSPPPAATAGVRAQAAAFSTNVKTRQAQYSEAAFSTNDKINRLARRPMCYKDECVDVFGDGLMKLVVDCYWPAPIETYRGKLVA